MSGIVDDRRTEEDKARTTGFVIARDMFMSGWGQAPILSLFAVPFVDDNQAEIVLENMQARSEMEQAQIIGIDDLPRVSEGYHLSIRDMSDCSRFYEQGGFSE